MSAVNITKVVTDLATGGIWSDDNLAQSLDWEGDTGSVDAAIDQTKTHVQRTPQEIEQQLFKDKGLDTDTLNAITAKVERIILRSSGSEKLTLLTMVDGKLDEAKKEIEVWLKQHSERVASMEGKLDTGRREAVEKLDERLASLEFRVEALAGSITAHGAEEARMIQEAYAIIKDRKATEEEGETGSEPSIFQRMEDRSKVLADQLTKLEPIAAQLPLVRPSGTTGKSAKKKFGRRV